MLRQGKVSATLIVIVAFVVGLVAMALTAGESPRTASAVFMTALTEGDYETLTDMSLIEDVSREEMLEKWKYATEVAGSNFNFAYEITDESKPNDDTAIITMQYTKNAGNAGTYPEMFELQLHKTDDGWKVDVFALSRSMYPGLPR